MPKPKILVAIPAYRCAPQITRVLDEIDEKLASRVDEIAIIDNGSPDDTVKKALEYKKNGRLGYKLRVYQNIDNYNLGGTHKVAFLKAEKEGFTHVLILHGDNQAKSDEGNLLIDFADQMKIPAFHRKSPLCIKDCASSRLGFSVNVFT